MDTVPGIEVGFHELMGLRAEAARLAPELPEFGSSLFPQLYRSLIRGRGLEFDEVRAYQPGDDFRAIDWRVTARTGRLHTMVFHEEREQMVFLAVDAGSSMRFGTRNAFKWVCAARAAALFAWLGVGNQDRVGGMVFGAGGCHESRPRSGLGGATRLFKLLERASSMETDGGAADLAGAMTCLRRLVRPGALILVFSDFADVGAQAKRHLSYLAQHNNVALVLTYDPLETELPEAGRYFFSDGEGMLPVDCADRVLRRTFHGRFTEHRDSLAAWCRRHRIRFSTIGTQQPLVAGLRDGFFGHG